VAEGSAGLMTAGGTGTAGSRATCQQAAAAWARPIMPAPSRAVTWGRSGPAAASRPIFHASSATGPDSVVSARITRRRVRVGHLIQVGLAGELADR
jgi:hypothetical protein